ncbi:MAG: GNAT family N-acetyltransferase [Armatimonadetes bacterium]|nr:GNAT family N-acetyltransferase [Armatimonadota bacterium]
MNPPPSLTDDLPLIRQMTEADISACARIYVEAFSHAPYHEEWRVEDAAELLSLVRQKEPDLGFCLEWKGAVAGFVLCATLGRFRATVEEFALHPVYQGRGWGRHLLDHCLDLFRQQGYTRVDLLANATAPAFGFYRKMGFRPSSQYVLMIREL